jgi:hypothetical protein
MTKPKQAPRLALLMAMMAQVVDMGVSSMSGGFTLGQVGRLRTLRAYTNPSSQNLAIGNKRSAQIKVLLYKVVL